MPLLEIEAPSGPLFVPVPQDNSPYAVDKGERRAVETFTGRLRIQFGMFHRVERAAWADFCAAFQAHATLDYLTSWQPTRRSLRENSR